MKGRLHRNLHELEFCWDGNTKMNASEAEVWPLLIGEFIFPWNNIVPFGSLLAPVADVIAGGSIPARVTCRRCAFSSDVESGSELRRILTHY
jgi:hypothetical protein